MNRQPRPPLQLLLWSKQSMINGLTSGGGPCVIMGDLNSTLAMVPAVDRLLRTKGWIDVGERANLFGGISNQPTCLAPSAKHKRRRDYAFVSPLIVPYISRILIDIALQLLGVHTRPTGNTVADNRTDGLRTCLNIHTKPASAIAQP